MALIKLCLDFVWIDYLMGVFEPPVRVAINCLMIDFWISDFWENVYFYFSFYFSSNFMIVLLLSSFIFFLLKLG